MLDKAKKLSKQWSTYRGLFLTVASVVAFPVVQAVEVVDLVLSAGTAGIGLYETLKDDSGE
jgi:hypothetical protein